MRVIRRAFLLGTLIYPCRSLSSLSPLAPVSVTRQLASVRLGLDFARFLCQSSERHHLAAGPCPAHNLFLHLTGILLRCTPSGENGVM